jgi:hypothetical protein
VYCGNCCFDFYDGDIKMNERILSPQLLKLVQAAGPGYSLANPEWVKKFAELIVRMCADAADMYEGKSDCVGDCVAEYMGYGQEEGVTEWRAK